MLAIDILAQGGDTADSIENALGVAQTTIEVAGTVAFAISAALLAGEKRMNVVGVVVFAVLVAVGGGAPSETSCSVTCPSSGSMIPPY